MGFLIPLDCLIVWFIFSFVFFFFFKKKKPHLVGEMLQGVGNVKV